ncbi:hypothetical protein [Acinetobacter baumannii]|uniref:hypothetical protein n=1 Tax=Acinetobacter baumannii TaxID=470 RepID=UPI001D175DE8|nr:hypothetical protein [Acinetobacter baumannii]
MRPQILPLVVPAGTWMLHDCPFANWLPPPGSAAAHTVSVHWFVISNVAASTLTLTPWKKIKNVAVSAIESAIAVAIDNNR